MTIDWDFISRHEGGCRLSGYVPAAATSQSGVTVATGVDLGQRSSRDLQNMGLPQALQAKLAPYCGLRAAAAQRALAALPLSLTPEEARLLDEAAARPIFNALRRAHDAATAPGAFDRLPDAIQTALASVAYQYGANLQKRTPRFWRAATRQDWTACILELEDFGDAYARRRRDEAALIRRCLTTG